jgi:hypothetical protein
MNLPFVVVQGDWKSLYIFQSSVSAAYKRYSKNIYHEQDDVNDKAETGQTNDKPSWLDDVSAVFHCSSSIRQLL